MQLQTRQKKENSMRFFQYSCFESLWKFVINHETTSAQPNGAKTPKPCKSIMKRITGRINPLLLHLAVTYNCYSDCFCQVESEICIGFLKGCSGRKNSEEKKRNFGKTKHVTPNGASCWCTSTLRQLLRLSRAARWCCMTGDRYTSSHGDLKIP